MVKVKIDLSGKDATFISNSYRYSSGLCNLHLYRNPPEKLPSLEQVRANIDRLQQAYEGGSNGDRVQIALRKKARKDVTEIFTKIQNYLRSVATEDDVPALLQAGFEVRQSAARRKSAVAPVT